MKYSKFKDMNLSELGLMKLYTKQVKLKRIFKYCRNLFTYMTFSASTKLKVLMKHKYFDVTKKKIATDSNKSEVAYLGYIDYEYVDSEKKCLELCKNLDNPDLLLLSMDTADAIPYSEKIYNIQKDDMVCFELTDKTIGCTCIDLSEYDSLEQVEKEMLRRKIVLKKNDAKYIVAYVKGTGNSEFELWKKTIGLIGYDYVVCIDHYLKRAKAYRTLNFNETRVFYSVGGTKKIEKLSSIQYINKSLIAIRLTLVRHNDKILTQREGYIPFVSTKNCELKKIDVGLDKKSNRLININKIMQGFRNWEQLFTLNEIMDVLDISIPSKYDYLKDTTINQICARTFELAPGNIFFFRQQFNDKNDTEQQSEFLRTRLALRAFTRKALFVFSYKKLPKFIPHIVMNDPREAHIKVMSWYKTRFLTDVHFIGVTGSIGKTSTKDMVHCAINECFETGKNIRNTNVQVKIGLNMQRTNPNCKFFVQEIGGGRPGGASRHSRMINPDLAIITNIGTAHIGNFGSKEQLMKNKLEIIDGMPESGILLLNGDDSLLWEAESEHRTVYYAVNNKNADYYADNITEEDGETYFDVVHKDTKIPIKLKVLGGYNVLNAVCAYAIGNLLGMDDNSIVKGLLKFKTEGIRQNLINLNGYKLFLDCYNASLESVKTSLSVLEKIEIEQENGRRFAIIGDITGVGDLQEVINEKVAETLSNHNIDEVVCFGEQAHDVIERTKKYAPKIKTNEFHNEKDLEIWMSNNIKPGDVVLLKGSSKSKLAERVDNVFGTNTADQNYIDEAQMTSFKKGDIEYRVFPKYVSIKKCSNKKEFVEIKSKFAGRDVVKILRKAFYNNVHVKKVKLDEGIFHIGSNCFENCTKLEEVILPESVKFVGAKAFYNCSNLKKVIFKSTPIFIGKDAFGKTSEELEIIGVQEKDRFN